MKLLCKQEGPAGVSAILVIFMDMLIACLRSKGSNSSIGGEHSIKAASASVAALESMAIRYVMGTISLSLTQPKFSSLVAIGTG